MLSWWPAACCLSICMTFFALKIPPRVIICTVQSARSFDHTLANAPVHIDPGPRSFGCCCREEPRLAARTGGRIRRRRKGPNFIHGKPLVLAAVFWIYSIAMLSLAPERISRQGCLDSLQGPPPPPCFDTLASQSRTVAVATDKRERHRQDEVALVFWSLIKLLKQK